MVQGDVVHSLQQGLNMTEENIIAPPTANIYDADVLIAATPNSNMLINNNPDALNSGSIYWESPEQPFDADAYMNDIANMATAVHNIDFDGDYLFEEEILIDLPGENEYQTSSVAVPWRATYTKLLLSAVSEIAKFSNLKSLTLFKKFSQSLTLVVTNFSDVLRTWNVADIFVVGANGILKVFPDAPIAGATAAEILAYQQACDADNVFLSILVTLLAGEAMACIDGDIENMRPGSGRAAWEKLKAFVKNDTNGYFQNIKKLVKAWTSAFTISKHPSAQLQAYKALQHDLGRTTLAEELHWVPDIIYE